MADVKVLEVVQQYIYDHPLYNIEKGKKILAIVGEGEYAESFADLALQTYQMKDDVVSIEWYCEAEVKASYLQPRPFLKEFISINGAQAPSKKETYGKLTFKDIATFDDADKDKYVLIFDLRDGMSIDIPECLPEEISDLDRMAFNTHRIWEGEGNIDYDRMKERFKDPYYRTSSQSFALSIPYKLLCAGIEIDSAQDAANKFAAIVEKAHEDPASEEARTIGTISMLEHRRWMLEKVCAGAGPYASVNGKVDYTECVKQRSVKKFSQAKKLIAHPCIVRSTEKTPLSTGSYTNYINWDIPNGLDSKLDELDRMSIELHRAMLAAANDLRVNQGILYKEVNQLEHDLGEFPERQLRINFFRYRLCIKNIMDVSTPYSAQFETYEKDLVATIEASHRDDIDLLKERVLKIRDILYPVLESNLYRDYKSYDTKLVENIPFILTAKRNVRLSASLGPCDMENSDNGDYFPCVASATVLFADAINYLFVLEESTEIKYFEFKIRAINRYFKARGKSVSLKINAFYTENVKEKAESLKSALKSLKDEKQISDYMLSFVPGDEELVNQAVISAQSASSGYYDGTLPLCESSLAAAKFTIKVSDAMPYFEFNSAQGKFINTIGCDELSYMNPTQFIQVEDMFALMNAQDLEMKYQDYTDTYMDYFSIYSGTAFGENDLYLCSFVWTKLCEVLKQKDTLNVRGVFSSTNESEISCAGKMLQAMKDKELIDSFGVDESRKGEEKYKGPTVTAVIRDDKVKAMFSKAGDILETYVFFKACEEDWFDDVQTGYKFTWEKDKVVNELDCVLTRGFKSILAECKSVKNPSEDFYLILDSLGDHFGINCKKVLIMVSDMSEKQLYLSRGKQMDIITIWKKEEILNIGKTLRKIIDGTYSA